MISTRGWVFALAISFSLSCASSGTTPVPTPKPLPPASSEMPPAVSADSSSQGPWIFAYMPGRAAYIVTRSATIQRVDSISGQDSATSRGTVSTNTTREVLIFESELEGTKITAAVDSFTPVLTDIPNPAVQLNLHPQISALLAANTLTVDSDTAVCNPIKSALLADIRNLVVPFPDSLTPGLSWKDSVEVTGCQAGIPTSSQITRSFMVKGEVLTEGQLSLEVVRSDTARLTGEGGLQRHRTSIRAVGIGSGIYYLDVKTGQILRLDVNQVLNVDVITLANKSQFQQHLTQEFLLDR